jgi:hypothetical protein
VAIALLLILSVGAPSAIAGQAPPSFVGIIGAILNPALRDQPHREWQNRPIADYGCLEAHNLSTDRLAANGISPNDYIGKNRPRLLRRSSNSSTPRFSAPI